MELKTMQAKSIFYSLLFLISTSSFAADSAPNNWYQGLFFSNPSMNFEFIRGLGYTYEQGADIGEAIATAQLVKPETINKWYSAWLDRATQTYLQGQDFKAGEDSVSASQAFLRASNYYRMASFYMDSVHNRAQAISTWKMSKRSFETALRSLPYFNIIEIPYAETTLHGYFLKAKNPNAPLVILNTGFDGTAQELFFVAGRAAHRQGYHVLFFDGPGQGQSIKLQRLAFRPDWEKVVQSAINYAKDTLNLKHNKIALIGFSMGGYLAARACAFIPEISACILDPGVYDFKQTALSHFPAEMLELLGKNPQKFNQIVKQVMEKNISANWFFNNGMWAFNVSSPAKLLNKLAPYHLGDWVKQMKMPKLVIDNAADSLIANQSEKAFKALPSPKTLLMFTEKSSAQAHCQAGSTAYSNEVIFNWLNKVLNFYGHAAKQTD